MRYHYDPDPPWRTPDEDRELLERLVRERGRRDWRATAADVGATAVLLVLVWVLLTWGR